MLLTSDLLSAICGAMNRYTAADILKTEMNAGQPGRNDHHPISLAESPGEPTVLIYARTKDENYTLIHGICFDELWIGVFVSDCQCSQEKFIDLQNAICGDPPIKCEFETFVFPIVLPDGIAESPEQKIKYGKQQYNAHLGSMVIDV
jgi:hypothetical protein